MSEDRSRIRLDPLPKPARCPLCGKPRQQRFRPFCSARCRDVDLGRWFEESYSIPATEPGYDEDQED